MTLPTSIPLRRDTPDNTGMGEGGDASGLAAVGILLVVAIFVVAWWRQRNTAMKRTGDTQVRSSLSGWWSKVSNNDLKPLRSTRLTAHHSLHEVHWQGKCLLIGCAEKSICLLAETPLTTKKPLDNPNLQVSEVSQADGGLG